MNVTPLRRRPLAWLEALAASALLLVSLVGYVEDHALCEVVSDYRPYYALTALLLAVAVAFRDNNRWRTAQLGMLALTLAINCWELRAAWWTAPQGATFGQRLTVATFNVEVPNRSHSEVRAWALAQSPDVLLFCEVAQEWPSALAPLTNQFPHHVRVAELDFDLYSKHPLTAARPLHFGERRGLAEIGVQLPAGTVRFIAAHASPRLPQGRRGYKERNAFLSEGLGRSLQSLSGSVVVMGDFNATPWSPAYRQSLAASGLKDARGGHGLLLTRRSHDWPARLLWTALDHCWVSREVGVERVSRGPYLGSDHRPVIVSLLVPTGR